MLQHGGLLLCERVDFFQGDRGVELLQGAKATKLLGVVKFRFLERRAEDGLLFPFAHLGPPLEECRDQIQKHRGVLVKEGLRGCLASFQIQALNECLLVV